MIAKEIAKKNHSSFSKLANYITRENTLKARISNCGDLPYQAAIKCIESLQDLARSGKDKTYHLVLSFHKKDDLTAERLVYIENECCKALGFENHQRFSVLHNDTNNPHLHIVINRVHPQTIRQITPYYSYKALAKFCQRMEIELELTVDNHIPNQEISAKARDMEAYSGKASLLRYLIKEVKPFLKNIKKEKELKDNLKRFGLVLEKNEKGNFVVGDGDVFVNAKHLGDEALKILSGGEGSYLSLVKTEKQYQPAQADDLWQEYQNLRNQSFLNRKKERKEIKHNADRHYSELLNKYQKLRHEIQYDRILSNKQKFELYQRLAKKRHLEIQQTKKHFQQVRKTMSDKNPLPTWQDFLVSKALDGNKDALNKLSHMASRRETLLHEVIIHHPTLAEAMKECLLAEKEKKETLNQRQAQLTTWINSRNELLGKVSDIEEHRYFGKTVGDFNYRGVREIANKQFVALLSKESITYVKPISEAQARFLKTLRRGDVLSVDEKGQFNAQKQKRGRS